MPLASTDEFVVEVKVGLVMITDCGFTVTLVDVVDEAPTLSVTVAFTVYVPPILYWCVALAAATDVPSPKLMMVEAMLPSGSVEPVAEAVIEPPATIELALTLKTATGG